MTELFTYRDCVVHLDGTGPISVASNEPGFWAVRDRPELNTGQILSVFAYAKTWDYQERHPDGDEFAMVLDGDVEFLVDGGGGESPVRLGRGSACVVPTGAWHRIALYEPSTILFITPVPERTQHRPLSATVGEESLPR